ncbi:DEAD/DEAH box helicase [Paenibacillus hexagrammi]|uniref:DEAD/DEAH box helicase n=1 Tax=Paenibacillus hexagrammi TaxID=2908839 RepID=A0ABY3SPP7_9BACL|nr:DEAD/DEAH box helicase [Paenibacillus sp. YPD9-1]
MSFQLTDRIIKLLCGARSFEQGLLYQQEGKVAVTEHRSEPASWEAWVYGKSRYQVAAAIDRNGDVDASCSCTTFYQDDDYCEHIAALLLTIQEAFHDGRKQGRVYPSLLHNNSGHSNHSLRGGGKSAPLSEEYELTNRVMSIFSSKKAAPSRSRTYFDNRSVLQAEFTCKAFSYRTDTCLFGIELKIGAQRLYKVQKMKTFLEHVAAGRPYVFTNSFMYEPELHSFKPEDDRLIRSLVDIFDNESLYRETLQAQTAYAPSSIRDRILLIPPSSWDALLPLLAQASMVHMEHEGRSYPGFQLSKESLPLQFELTDSDEDGYALVIDGLDDITVMEPYRYVLYQGRLLKVTDESGKRLSELKQMMASLRKPELKIISDQMASFVQKVIPGLMDLGHVRIKESIADLFVQAPLTAKLYLDRVRDRLLAGLEFQYGDVAINPLEDRLDQRGEDRILIRDENREQKILELMEMSAFAQTESGYFMDDEEGEYEFLSHIVPQLEELVHVYATSAVKARIFVPPSAPKVRVNVGERTDWLEFKFDIGGIPETEIRKVLQSIVEKRRYYRMPGGSLMPLESEEFQEIVRFLNEVGFRREDLARSTFQIPMYRGLHLMEKEGAGSSIKISKPLRQLLDNVKNPDHLDFPVPVELDPVLRDYQKYGFQWMKMLAYYGFGGILADDMGLGKTIQSITFLVSELPAIRERKEPALIVSPASLVYNWQGEFEKFAPFVRTAIADGSREERAKLIKHASEYDVILTSYPLLRRDMDLFASAVFHTVIMDEAQAFKNHATLTAQTVKTIQARHRFALSGTPIENSLEELWSIFDAVFPDLFPGRKSFNELSRETIAKRARPFMLRRVKSDVLRELPDKIETVHSSELEPAQKKLYAAYLAQLQQETLKHLSVNGFEKSRIKILAGITRLRQICCHPSLFIENYEGSSAKYEQLLEIIEDCRSAGRRMLVFSQFTEMLGLIGRELGYRGVPYFYLDGSTPTRQRVELCSRFNNGEKDLFLISLKAGGTGLNLTGADTVLLYDLWWNPAVEQQAADRAHRIGQKKVVQIIRLVAQGTVEEKMLQLQMRKKHLIEEVVEPESGQEQIPGLSEQDIKDILMI